MTTLYNYHMATKTEKLRLQYNAISCKYYDDEDAKQLVNNLTDHIRLKDNKNSILLSNIMNNGNIKNICIVINNNYIIIRYQNYNYGCIVLDGNYQFNYRLVLPLKHIFVNMIRNHNFIYDITDLFETIKDKCYIIKSYFNNIVDIYKYILPIIKNVYMDDDDIMLKLFFDQYMKIRLEYL